jgi:hypothetical protein
MNPVVSERELGVGFIEDLLYGLRWGKQFNIRIADGSVEHSIEEVSTCGAL